MKDSTKLIRRIYYIYRQYFENVIKQGIPVQARIPRLKTSLKLKEKQFRNFKLQTLETFKNYEPPRLDVKLALSIAHTQPPTHHTTKPT